MHPRRPPGTPRAEIFIQVASPTIPAAWRAYRFGCGGVEPAVGGGHLAAAITELAASQALGTTNVPCSWSSWKRSALGPGRSSGRLVLEQPDLAVETAAVAGRAAVGADHPVAGDDDPHGPGPLARPHRAGEASTARRGYFPIADRLAVRDLPQLRLTSRALEVRSLQRGGTSNSASVPSK